MVKTVSALLISMLMTLMLSAVVLAAGPGADAILGIWVTQGGKAHVEITVVNGRYQGRIIWLKQPNYPADDDKGMAGQPKVDRENPNKTLRSRPIIGLQLVSGFRYAGDSKWTDGKIYDPESGNTYHCKMTMMPDGSLKVRGYIGFSLFGRTEVWTRLPETKPGTPST